MPGAGSEFQRVARGRFASTEQKVGTEELKEFLSSDEVRRMTDQEIADKLRETHGVGVIRETINAVRHRLGITKLRPEPIKTDVDLFLADDATRGLSNKEVSDLLQQKFGVAKSPNAVRKMRERRGLEPPGTHGGAHMATEEKGRIEALLKSEPFTAVSDRQAERLLKSDHGISYSFESIRKLRKTLRGC